MIRNFTVVLSLFLVLSFGFFPFLEAGLALAANSATVTAREQVTAEIAITVGSNALTMSPAIPGMTGGTGTASTQVTIITNNKEGYNVTLAATSGPAAMQGDATEDYFIDYQSSAPETWVDTNAGGQSQFGFGITNGSAGNTATGYTSCPSADSCFFKATTTPKNIYTTTGDTTAAGDSFTLKFRAHLPANPNPQLTEDWYTATTTLTVTMI